MPSRGTLPPTLGLCGKSEYVGKIVVGAVIDPAAPT
jgi:hypothetical protein